MKMIMKSSLLMGGVLLLASCGDSSQFTKGTAESAASEVMQVLEDNYNYSTVKTGYYECDDDGDRLKLRKLAAAGVVTYKAEKVTDVRGGWYSYNVDHVFVTVALTEEGQKYVLTQEEVDAIDEARSKAGVDEDLHYSAMDEEYPEDAVPVEETFPGDKAGSSPSDSGSASSSSSADYSSTSSSSDAAEMSAYEKAKARENSETVYVETFKVRVAKARNLRCTEEMMKDGKATAEVIIECFDVTPFGRILGGVREGERDINKLSFIYYNDKGWVADFEL